MMRLVLAEVLAVAGMGSAGMMVTGGMMAETDPVPGLGGSAAGVIYGGIATAIVTGIGAILSSWFSYDLKRRESDRLDKVSEDRLAAIESRATSAEGVAAKLRDELENSKHNWHEERKMLGDKLDRAGEQLDKAYEMVEKVSGQLAALNHRAEKNTAMIEATREQIDLPPLPIPTIGDAK